MNDNQLLRYSRHLLLNEIGIKGQEKLLSSHALIIGAGGLGSPASLYLTSAGIGKITLVDDDNVDLTNLQRQILFITENVGKNKAVSGKNALKKINPDIEVNAICDRASLENLDKLVSTSSIVLDCSDNFSTRHNINQVCVKKKIPLVSGAAIRFDGQISVFDLRNENSGCYACIFPPDQDFVEEQCSTMGVFSPLVGIIGATQAAEAIKVLVGKGETLFERLLMLNALNMEWTQVKTSRNPNCLICMRDSF